MRPWKNYHRPVATEIWSGRHDTKEAERVFRWVTTEEPHASTNFRRGIVLIGFACDEGVARNEGRRGASGGPNAIRKALANLCLDAASSKPLYDWGDIVCEDDDLEGAQSALAEVVGLACRSGLKPLVLGGGHETAWGHFQGLAASRLGRPPLGIVNFDAHLDLRPLLPGEKGSSGTSFRQMAHYCEQNGLRFDYTCLGLQELSNTRELFTIAQQLGVEIVTADAILHNNESLTLKKVNAVIGRCESIYVTFCLDVLSASLMPGVSAPQPWGLMPWHLLPALRALMASGHVVGFDVVELAPNLDPSGLSTRQAAHFVADAIRHWR